MSITIGSARLERIDCEYMETFKENRGDLQVTVVVFSDGEMAHMFFNEKGKVVVEEIPLEHYDGYKEVLVMEYNKNREKLIEHYFYEVFGKDKRYNCMAFPKEMWKKIIKPRMRKGAKLPLERLIP